MARELTLATLKHPNSWDSCWRPLLLVHVILQRYKNLESLHDHPYVYERWWTVESGSLSLKLLLSNEDGTSMVLLGTSPWDTENSFTARWV